MDRHIRTMRLLTAALLLTGATSVHAQDVTVAYQFQRFMAEGVGLNANIGVNADATFPINNRLRWVVGVDWSRYNESRTLFGTRLTATTHHTTLGGGVRVEGSTLPILPHAQVLVGAMRSTVDVRAGGASVGDEGATHLMMSLGAGVSAPLTGGLKWVVQGDYRRVFVDDAGVNGLRVLVGVRLFTES